MDSAPSAFVLLAVGDSNNVFGNNNDSLFFEYKVYKKRGEIQVFRMYETIQIPKEPYNMKSMLFPCRDRDYSLNDRYMIKPVSNGEEQDAIPLKYYTMHSSYYSEIEHAPMESSEENVRL